MRWCGHGRDNGGRGRPGCAGTHERENVVARPGLPSRPQILLILVSCDPRLPAPAGPGSMTAVRLHLALDRDTADVGRELERVAVVDDDVPVLPPLQRSDPAL